MIIIQFFFTITFAGLIFYNNQPLLIIDEWIKVYILDVTRHVSPDFYPFHNFWKEKISQVSPTHTTKLFGF